MEQNPRWTVRNQGAINVRKGWWHHLEEPKDIQCAFEDWNISVKRGLQTRVYFLLFCLSHVNADDHENHREKSLHTWFPNFLTYSRNGPNVLVCYPADILNSRQMR